MQPPPPRRRSDAVLLHVRAAGEDDGPVGSLRLVNLGVLLSCAEIRAFSLLVPLEAQFRVRECLDAIGNSFARRRHPVPGRHARREFKTLRADRIVGVLEQISKDHEPSIRPQPTYGTDLPKFPLPNAVYRIPTVAVSNRTWKVDLNLYTCTCPEKRIRFGAGYMPGKIGYVCPHMARAILVKLPAAAGWPPEVLAFLSDPRKMHIDNLI
jgi:hypothetical protein